MLVGSTSINVEDILKLKDDKEALISFIESKIPPLLKHNDGVRYNTLYYCNYIVQSNNKVSLKDKKLISDILTKNIHIVGVLDRFYSLEDIDGFISWKRVNKYLEGDKYGKSL